MTDVYKIGVSVEMKNLMSSVLRTVIGDLKMANAKALEFKATMTDLKIMGGIGLVAGGLGVGGIEIMKRWVGAASQYQSALQKFQSMGIGDAMLDDADKFARGSQVVGASATDLMNTARDLTMILGKAQYPLARQLAPMMSQLNWAAGSVFKDKWSENQELAMMKVIEMKGGWQNADQFGAQANMMTQVMSGTGGSVSPSDYLAFIKTSGVAGRLLSNPAFYFEMEPMIQELGGQRAGTGLMSAYNNLSQGRMTVRAAREMMRIGLLDPKDVEYDSIGQVKTVHPGALRGNDLFTSDPLSWMKTVMIPALQQAGFKDQKSELQEMGALFGNRTASALYSLMLIQQDKIQKNMDTTTGAMGVGGLIELAQSNPTAAMAALGKSLTNLSIAMGRVLIPIIIPALEMLTKTFNYMAAVMKEHPLLASLIAKGFALMSVALLGLAAAMPFMMLNRLFKLVSGVEILGKAMSILAPVAEAIFMTLLEVCIFLVANPVGLTLMAVAGGIYALYKAGTMFHNWLQGHPWLLKMMGGTPDSTIPPPPPVQMPGQRVTVNMDGRKVGEIVSGHQAAAAGAPPSSGNSFDTRHSSTWAGAASAGAF